MLTLSKLMSDADVPTVRPVIISVPPDAVRILAAAAVVVTQNDTNNEDGYKVDDDEEEEEEDRRLDRVLK